MNSRNKSVFISLVVFISFMLCEMRIAGGETIGEYIIGNTIGTILVSGEGIIHDIRIEDKIAYMEDFYGKPPVNKRYSVESDYKNPALAVLLYGGYPHNGYGLQEKYNLTADKYQFYTQSAVFYVTEKWDKNSIYDYDQFPYLKELLLISDNYEKYLSSPELSQDSITLNKDDSGYISDFINTQGPEGSFRLKLPEGISAKDNKGNIREEYSIGEEYRIVSNSKQLEKFNISVTFNYIEPYLNRYAAPESETSDLYTSENRELQRTDNITVQIEKEEGAIIPDNPSTGEGKELVVVLLFISISWLGILLTLRGGKIE